MASWTRPCLALFLGRVPAALTRQGDAAEPALLESGDGRRLRCFLYGAEGLTGEP